MLHRADSPMMAREIAAKLAARYQIDASNMDAMNALVAKVGNTLARQRGLASEMPRCEGVAGSKPEERSTSLSSLRLP